MSNNSNDGSNEWKTVTRGKYVPPSKRSEVEKRVAEEEKKKPLDFASDKNFPTLGVTTKAASWGDKKTFTETIHGLIALEQRTAEEREAAEEEARKNEGIAVLKIPRTAEEFIGFNERMYVRAQKVEKEMELIEFGLQKLGDAPIPTRDEPTLCTEEFIQQMNAEDDEFYKIYYQNVTPFTTVASSTQMKSGGNNNAAQRKSLLERKRQSLLARRAAAMATA